MMPWQSQCRTCGNQVAPLLNNIKKGQRGCKWCSGRVIDPAEAAEVMRAAGLEPLTAYPGAHAPCRCQRCHEAVTPRYRAVQAGSGCRYCNDTAINPEAAVSLMREAGLEHGSCGRMVAAGYCCGRCPGLFTLGLFRPA
jgi:hypothetical protein